MARERLEVIDIPSLVAFPGFAGVVLGVWVLALSTFNFDFGGVLFNLGGVGISVAFIGAMLAEVALVVQGYVSRGDYRDIEWYLIVVLMAILPIYKFVPIVQNLLDTFPILKFILWIAISGLAVFVGRQG